MTTTTMTTTKSCSKCPAPLKIRHQPLKEAPRKRFSDNKSHSCQGLTFEEKMHRHPGGDTPSLPPVRLPNRSSHIPILKHHVTP